PLHPGADQRVWRAAGSVPGSRWTGDFGGRRAKEQLIAVPEKPTTLRHRTPEGRRVSVLETTLEPRLRTAAHGRLRVSRQAVVPGERHPSEELVIRQVPGKRVQQPVIAQVDPAVAAFQQKRVALVVEQLGEQRLLSYRAGIGRQVS